MEIIDLQEPLKTAVTKINFATKRLELFNLTQNDWNMGKRFLCFTICTTGQETGMTVIFDKQVKKINKGEETLLKGKPLNPFAVFSIDIINKIKAT